MIPSPSEKCPTRVCGSGYVNLLILQPISPAGNHSACGNNINQVLGNLLKYWRESKRTSNNQLRYRRPSRQVTIPPNKTPPILRTRPHIDVISQIKLTPVRNYRDSAITRRDHIKFKTWDPLKNRSNPVCLSHGNYSGYLRTVNVPFPPKKLPADIWNRRKRNGIVNEISLLIRLPKNSTTTLNINVQ